MQKGKLRFLLPEPHQSCLTLCDPVDCSPPGSSVHGILQARILEWGAISFSRRELSRVQVSNTCRATTARVPVAPAPRQPGGITQRKPPPCCGCKHPYLPDDSTWPTLLSLHLKLVQKNPPGKPHGGWKLTMFKTNPFTAPAPALRPAPPHGLQHHSQGRHGPKPETTRLLPPPLTLPCIQPAAVPCQASCEPSFMRLPPLHGHHLSFPDLQAASRLPSTYTVYTNNPGKAQAGTAPQTPGPTLRSSGSHEG